MVQGDTTSALAGALAANACDIALVHVEAGLRSYDRRMPEEQNRVLIDHLANVCCAPTEVNRTNLLRESIADERIVVTGNTVVEALRDALPPARERHALLDRLQLVREGYVLATLHRPENVDTADMLEAVLVELSQLPLPVLIPLHPRTAGRVTQFGLGNLLRRLRVIQPLGYRDFLALASYAAILVSDSGGIQEEASILKRPVVVVRRSTERPEIEGTFGALVRPGPRIGQLVREWLDGIGDRYAWLATIPSPYGDGHASALIAVVLNNLIAGAYRTDSSSESNDGHVSPHDTPRAAR